MPQPGQAPCPGATRIGMAVVSFTEPPETFIFPVAGSKVQVVRPGEDSFLVTGLKIMRLHPPELAIDWSALPEVPEAWSAIVRSALPEALEVISSLIEAAGCEDAVTASVPEKDVPCGICRIRCIRARSDAVVIERRGVRRECSLKRARASSTKIVLAAETVDPA